jgi:hypothetical protein
MVPCSYSCNHGCMLFAICSQKRLLWGISKHCSTTVIIRIFYFANNSYTDWLMNRFFIGLTYFTFPFGSFWFSTDPISGTGLLYQDSVSSLLKEDVDFDFVRLARVVASSVLPRFYRLVLLTLSFGSRQIFISTLGTMCI